MAGGTTLYQIGHSETLRNVRKRLRVPKGEAPGWSHDLHALWDAYLKLESRCLDAENRIHEAREALNRDRA